MNSEERVERLLPGESMHLRGLREHAVEVEEQRTIVSVIGEGLRNTPGIAARVFSTMADINVSMISVGASSVNLTFMVDDAHAHEVIARLHRVCFEDQGCDQDSNENQEAEVLV